MKYISINRTNIIIKNKKIRPINLNEVLIKVKFVGLCGSDLHRINDVKFKQKTILGHEIVGEIIESFNPNFIGKNVLVNPIIGCGKCSYCKKGDIQLCKNIKAIGRNIDGGFAEYVIVHQENILILDKKIDLKLGTLVDGAAVIFHGLHLLKKYNIIKKELKIAIIGDGTIGMLTAIIFSNYTKKITIFSKKNKDMIKSLGFSVFSFENISKIEDDSFDLTIECVGGKQDETLNEAFRITKSGGSILVFGVYPDKYFSQLQIRLLFYKEILLLGCNSYGYHNNVSDFKLALSHIQKHPNKYKKLITNQIPFEKFKLGIIRQKNSIKTIYYF